MHNREANMSALPNTTVVNNAPRFLVPLLAIAGMPSMLNNSILGPFMPEMSRDLSVSVPLLGQVTADEGVQAMTKADSLSYSTPST
jgi:hypothetical protein